MNDDVLSASVQKSARDRILGRIKAGLPTEVELPEVPMYEVAGDKVANFIAKLESFDGKVVRVADRGEAMRWLATHLDVAGKKVYSSVPQFKGNFEVDPTTDPHSTHVIDICVARGLFGVGETGSIWVTEESLGLTACALFSTDLYLLLDVNKIYGGMHEAYAAIDLEDSRYGSFYTGPSATADIEAVHITGAQGEISLTAILIG